ncbi:bifunctional DNA primase/polymerase [Streptomyces sp. NPDC058548]|uniref:bifunctional DNA primase/polymerase n=1 Tax=Streptomyces sp. NPDC058548 TaxID=3346545 RepID=UPI0036529A38
MKRTTWRHIAWLSEAADDPSDCLTTWAGDPRAPYPLPTGRVFDVVSVDQRVGLEALGQLLHRGMPFGPTLLDRRARRMGFLLAPRSRQHFVDRLGRAEGAVPAYRYLSHGSVVVVPGPRPLLGDRYEWLRAPARRPPAGPLLPVALAAVLVVSTEVLSCADRYGEDPRPAPDLAAAALAGVWALAG